MTAAVAPVCRVAGSPLSRRNPTVKLAVVFAVSATMLFVFDPITPAVLYVLALAGVLGFAGVAPRALALAHLPFAAFAVGLFVVNVLSRPGQVLWEAAGLRVTVEGISIGAALAMRTLLIGVLAIGFLVSTDPVALMTSLHQNARLSARVTYAILAGYRMLQELPREWDTIRRAHAVRAELRSDGTLPRSPRQLAGAVFTLLVVSVRKGERMAQSLESRGLGLSPRSTWRPMKVEPADWVLVAAVLAVVAAVLATGAATGTLVSFGGLS